MARDACISRRVSHILTSNVEFLSQLRLVSANLAVHLPVPPTALPFLPSLSPWTPFRSSKSYIMLGRDHERSMRTYATLIHIHANFHTAVLVARERLILFSA